MDLQKIINAQLSQIRNDRLSKSPQLLLGELKLKLETVQDKSKQIIFDFGMKPSGASSWRGAYCELGLEYSKKGGGSASWNTDEIEEVIGDYTFYKSETHDLPKHPTTKDFLDMLNAITDKTMTGYKGGDFVMHKNVAVYLANYGESDVYNYKGKEYATVAPVDVVEESDKVIIVTSEVNY